MVLTRRYLITHSLLGGLDQWPVGEEKPPASAAGGTIITISTDKVAALPLGYGIPNNYTISTITPLVGDYGPGVIQGRSLS